MVDIANNTTADGLTLNGVTGHSDYLDPGSTSQYNIAATIAGQPDKRLNSTYYRPN